MAERSRRIPKPKKDPDSITSNTEIKKIINSLRIKKSRAAERAYETYKKRQIKAGASFLEYLPWYDTIYMKRRSPPVRPKATTFRGEKARYVPCVPAVITDSGLKFEYETLNVMGHNYTKYTAGWLSVDEDMFGAFVRRMESKKTNLFQTRHLYVGNVHQNIANQISNKRQILNVAIANQYTNYNLVSLNGNNKIFIQPGTAGPGVGVTKSYIRKNPSYDLDLLSFKLIGDRFTVESASWVNAQKNHFFVKPYNYDIAKKLAEIYSSGKKGIVVEEELKGLKNYYYNTYFEKIQMNSREYKLPNFIFAGSVVLTNDRSLCLYAIFKKVPFIYESGGNYYYVNTDRVNDLYKTYFNPGAGASFTSTENAIIDNILNGVINVSNKNKNTREEYMKIVDRKLAVLDCFHDFAFFRGNGPEAGPLDFEKLIGTFKTLFDLQKELLDYLNNFTTRKVVEEAQIWITNIVKQNTTATPETIKNDLTKLGFSVTIDAGKRPIEFNKTIITSGLARHLNSASRPDQQVGNFS